MTSPPSIPPLENGIVLRVCRGPSCGRRYDALRHAIDTYITQENLSDRIVVETQHCFGKCFAAPNILVEKWQAGRRNETAMFALMLGEKHRDMAFEHQVRPDDIPAILRAYLERWFGEISTTDR